MEWKCFFTISAYIMTVCDPVLGATGITNVVLADGLTPNEGRVEYDRSESTQTSACGDGLSSQEASVVCRQLGYEGVNNHYVSSPFEQSASIDPTRLNCDGDEETLAECSLLSTSPCSNAGGVICYVLDRPPCVGRDIEKCGGDSQIALFNITLYLQNTNRTASPPGCAEPTPTQTEGDVSTTESIQSSPSTPPPQTTPPPPPASSSSPPPPSTVTPPSPSSPPSSSPSSSSSSSSPPMSPTSSPPSTTPSVLSTDRTTMEVMNPGVPPRYWTPTGMPGSTTRTTQTGVQGNIGLYIGVGAGGGILLLLIIILLVVFIIRRRRKVPTRTKENGPDPYMDLQPTPEADRTYQEMVITSTALSPKNRRKSSTIVKPVL